jgi:hypothetical protein
MGPHPPRVPAPPVPQLDWSTPAAYLRSCNAWLDQMQQWQSHALPEWIEQSRRYLLQNSLMNPESRAPLADMKGPTSVLVRQPLMAVPEMRLPPLE